MTINTNLSMESTIKFFNTMHLYEVEEKLNDDGVIYTIKRLKFSEDDITIEKIEGIIRQQKDGKIWQRKEVRKKEGTATYAGQKLYPDRKIQHIFLIKTDQNGEISHDIKNNIKVEKMDTPTISLLEKIMGQLKARFTADKVSKSLPVAPPLSSTQQTAFSKQSVKPVEVKKTSGKTKTGQESKKEMKQVEEEVNNKIQAEKREQLEISKELDGKTDMKRYKDISSHENQQIIVKNDQK